MAKTFLSQVDVKFNDGFSITKGWRKLALLRLRPVDLWSTRIDVPNQSRMGHPVQGHSRPYPASAERRVISWIAAESPAGRFRESAYERLRAVADGSRSRLSSRYARIQHGTVPIAIENAKVCHSNGIQLRESGAHSKKRHTVWSCHEGYFKGHSDGPSSCTVRA